MMASALIEELQSVVREWGDRPVVTESNDQDITGVDEGTEYSDAGERPIFIILNT